MPWPFRRQAPDPKSTPSRSTATPPAATAAEVAVLEAARAWWQEARPGVDCRLAGAAASLTISEPGGAGPGVVVWARRGKLVRVDVHDVALRVDVDAMVRHFEAAGQWSFNGVVRTVAGDAGPEPRE